MRPTTDTSHEMSSGSQPALAPVSDRFLAFALDIVLWLPLALIPARPVWRKFQYLSLVSPESMESYLHLAVASFIGVLIFILAQTLFVWRWGATPGKRILRLQVIDIQTGTKPSLGAACVRACSLVFEICLFAVPLLEILSQRERRPWHDRLAETKLITLKDIKSEEPHWIEVRFFRNLYWGSLACVFMMVGIFGTGLLRRADLGVFKARELEESGYLCDASSEPPRHPAAQDESARIDYALSLYRSGKLSRECLEAEADFAFWTQSEELMPWGHLVRGVLDKEDSKNTAEEHFLQACPIGKTGAVCTLAKWFNINHGLSEAEVQSWTGRTEKLRSLLKDGKFQALDKYASDEEWPMDFAGLVQEQNLFASFLEGKEEVFHALSRSLKSAWTDLEKMDMAAWSCWAETQSAAAGVGFGRTSQRGQNLRSSSCVNLGTMMQQGRNLSLQGLAALRFEAQTLNLENSELNLRLRQMAKEKSDYQWFAEKLNFQRSLEVLATLKKEDWAAPFILGEATLRAKSSTEFEKLAGIFQNFSREKSSWWVAFQSFEKRAPELFKSNLTEAKIERGLSSVKEEKPKKAPARESLEPKVQK